MVFQIRNTSSLPLEAGEVVLRVELDPHIAHMSSELVFQLALLPPSSTVKITVPIVLRADSLLFESYRWKAALVLRTKCIEFCQDQIRMAPIYGLFCCCVVLCFFFVISLCFVLARRDQQHGRECGLGRPLSRGHSASSALKGPLLVFLFCFMFVFC
jgi:hypothetical protein